MIDIKSTLTKTKKKINKKRLLIGGVAFLLVMFIIIGIAGGKQQVKYTTITPSTSDIISTISATGILNPTNEVLIGTVTSGIVLEVNVDVNDRIKKGDILAVINPEAINQEIDGLKAQLNSANALLEASKQTLVDKKWQYDSLDALHKKTNGKSPSQLELHNAKSAYQSALSDISVKESNIDNLTTSLNAAYIKLKNSQIISPIDGVVLSRTIEVGQSIAASFNAPELFRVAENLEEMDLTVNISEADIGKVKEGLDVIFSVDAYPEQTFNAKINRVSYGSTTVENIVSYETNIYVENKELLLKPGMSATVEIITASVKDALNVPISALYVSLDSMQSAKQPSKSGINSVLSQPKRPKKVIKESEKVEKMGKLWVLRNNEPIQIDVTTGISDGKNTQIISGVNQNDQIIMGIEQGK